MNRPDLLDDGPWAEVIAAAAQHPDQCALHHVHRPRNLALHRHHVWPLGMEGPNEAWNKITVCPTGHTNIHLILKMLHGGEAPRGGHAEKRIAALGYVLWAEAGKPGGRVTLADDHDTIEVPE